jgi:crotonobetainyl-CoA:carnitine CoA-transferase CaiB-like acyl-CoA transferase
MAGALDGIRVIDFGQWLAGPLTALLLADQGAEVIHVDPPGGPAWKTVANATLQRGKRCIVLDLKSTADLASARGLISSADVVIENFRPGVMDRLGLGWDTVRSAHDRLIYCSLPGFAADDPRAAMPAWEGVLAAATGTYTRRGAEDQPCFNALPLASEFGALAAAIAIVMALTARERDGLGQRLEVPLFDAMFLAFGASALLVNGAAAGGRPADPWSGTYQCRDGAMVLLNLATPRFVHRFLEATGSLQTWTAKGYLEPDRLVHDRVLWAQHTHELSALLRSRTAEEWDALATQVHLPLTRIRTSAAWIESRHAQDAGISVPVDHPEYGRMLQPGPSVRLHRPLSADAALPSERPAVIRAASATSPLTTALEGFRVVDTTQVLAGPTAARTLAEFGAEVIKINNPWEEGTGYRWQVHRYHTDVNRGKQTVLIDLKRQEGLALLWRLVENADAFLQNLRLGVAERLGIGYEQVRAHKPDIVYLAVSAFGYGGAWQYRPGYEPNRRPSLACRPVWVAAPTGRPVSPLPLMTIVRVCWEPLAWGWDFYIVSGQARDGASKRPSPAPRRSCRFRICRSTKARFGTSPGGHRRKAGGHSNVCIALPIPGSFWEHTTRSSSALSPSLACRPCRAWSMRHWQHSSKHASAHSQRASGYVY